MTRRFKKTVKAVVYDGIIDSEEKKLLEKIREEEGISATEAEIYITQELKKRKVKMSSNGGNWFTKNSGSILSTVASLGGIVLTAFLKGRK